MAVTKISATWSSGRGIVAETVGFREMLEIRYWWDRARGNADLDLALACKGIQMIARSNLSPLTCVALDGLMGIIQNLVSGDSDPGMGEELGWLQGLLLEDVELFMGAIEGALSLFLSVAGQGQLLDKNEASVIISTREAFISSYETAFSSRHPEGSLRRSVVKWDGRAVAGLIIACGSGTTRSGLPRAGQVLGERVVEFVAATCRGLDRMERTMDKTEMDSALCGAVRERLLALIADVMTDPRLPSLSAASESCLKGACPNPEAYTLLLDLARLRRTDALLKTLSDQGLLAVQGESEEQGLQTKERLSVQHELRSAVETVLELVSDPRRSPAVTLFYLDHSPARDTVSDVKSLAIPEALPHHLPEALQSKGDIALLVHLLALSNDALAVQSVLRVLCAILVDRPTSASLARLKPFVRRRVAEVLVGDRSLLCALLPRLLLFKGFAVPSNAAANWWAIGEAAGVRRGGLRLFTLLLDCTDDAADALASSLVEPLLSLLTDLLDFQRIVVRESFAAIKLVCFRQSQTSMSSVSRMFDAVLDALSLAAEGEKGFEWTGNVVELVTGLVVSLQTSWRQPTSDLSSATSAHVRASDTLSTISTSSEISYTSRSESIVATSAVTYLSSTGHMEYDDLSGVGSAVECLSNTDATELDACDDQESMDASVKADDSSVGASGAPEPSPLADEALLCTYTKTAETFSEQHWYHCWTCGLAFQEGVCAVCAKVCHRGHDLTYSRFSKFFCDCGAGKAHLCRALVPRGSQGDARSEARSDARESGTVGSSDKTGAGQEGRVGTGNRMKDMDMAGWLADCDRLPSQLTRQARETLLQKLRSAQVSQAVQKVYQRLTEAIMVRDGPFGSGEISLRALKTALLASSAKRRIVLRNTFAPLVGGPGGPSASKSPAQSRATRTPAEPGTEPAEGAAQRLALLASTAGELLLVCEGDQLTLLDISGLRRRYVAGGDQGQESIVLREKSVFPKPVGKLSLQWQPTMVVSNPACPEYVALAEEQQCWVYKISAAGKFLDAKQVS